MPSQSALPDKMKHRSGFFASFIDAYDGLIWPSWWQLRGMGNQMPLSAHSLQCIHLCLPFLFLCFFHNQKFPIQTPTLCSLLLLNPLSQASQPRTPLSLTGDTSRSLGVRKAHHGQPWDRLKEAKKACRKSVIVMPPCVVSTGCLVQRRGVCTKSV